MPLGAIGRLWYHQRYASSKVLTIRQGTFISDPSGIFQKESHMSSIHFLKPASAFGLAALLAFGGIPASALATAQYAWATKLRHIPPARIQARRTARATIPRRTAPLLTHPRFLIPLPPPTPHRLRSPSRNLNLSPLPSRPSPLSPPLKQVGTNSATHGTGVISDGTPQTGWLKAGGQWYCLNPDNDGRMAKGWAR